MEGFENQKGLPIIQGVISAIRDNAGMLSEIDGAVGDGDHGINMAKGFSMAADKLAADKLAADRPAGSAAGFSEGLSVIGTVLLTEIGGAMGPLYGTWFRTMGRECRNAAVIDSALFEAMLKKATEAVVSLGGATVGDKTMLDTLAPALAAFCRSRSDGLDFVESLCVMMKAAEEGKDSTRDLTARLGRSSRLGERSRGILDAGAVSCWLILTAMAQGMVDLLQGDRSCAEG
jgi:dihydroxyacetone kinase-like protein